MVEQETQKKPVNIAGVDPEIWDLARALAALGRYPTMGAWLNDLISKEAERNSRSWVI